MRFEVQTALPTANIPFLAVGQSMTLRRNEDDLFVASTKGIDVGIATSFNGKAKDELPSNIKGRIANIEKQKLLMIAKTPSLTN